MVLNQKAENPILSGNAHKKQAGIRHSRPIIGHIQPLHP